MSKWEYAAIVFNGSRSSCALVKPNNEEIMIEATFEVKNNYPWESETAKKFLKTIESLFDSKAVRKKTNVTISRKFRYKWKTHFYSNQEIIDWHHKFSGRTKNNFFEGFKNSYGIKGGKIERLKTFKPLFKSNDILELINLAGAEGWQITGGIGMSNSAPGGHGERAIHESRWRIMRREL